MDGIPPIGVLTPLAILCLVLATPYLLIARGKLIPASTVDRMVTEHTREIGDISHDRDEWRAAHRISEVGRVEQAQQVDRLLEHARTTEAFLRALPKVERSD